MARGCGAGATPLAGGKKLLALGAYPDIRLAEARELRDGHRASLRRGVDPSVERRIARSLTAAQQVQSFEAMAREWHARQLPTWTERHAGDVLDSLEKHVFPTLGGLHVNAITPRLVLAALRTIEARPAIETAHRVRQRMSAVFVYAISCGVGETDPAAIVKGALSPIIKGRQPALIEVDELRSMLTKVEAEPAHPVTKTGLRFLALTIVRPGELRAARWDEFIDLDGKEPIWRLPASRMKMKSEHWVPLSAQAVAVIEAMRPLSGRGPFVFPNARHAHKPMSENALGYLLNRAGYHQRHVPHGWRAAFSSIMNERHPGDHDAIEATLAHTVPGARGAYMRASFLARRRELLTEWADLLLAGMPPAENLILGPRRYGSTAPTSAGLL